MNLFLQKLNTILLAKTIDIDENAMKNLVKEFTKPMTNISLVIIPLLGGLACLYTGIVWMTKDEEEREQKPLGRSLKKIILLTFVLEAIPTLMKIFGWS